ncbi:major facilitator superfamily domain-containing protein [Aspergillus desertorum]
MERNTKESGRPQLITSEGGLEVEVRRSIDETSAMELSTRTTHPQSTEESSLVQFDDGDNLNPHNWPLKKKFYTFALVSFATMVVSMTSSIFSTVVPAVSSKYEISRAVGNLGVSLYVLGFATGPLIWAPFSELKGRRLPFVLSMFGFTVFSFATAASKDLQSVFICRFFAGFFGASPFTLAGAICSDMLSAQAFTNSMVGFGITVFSGPLLAPTIGGFIVMDEHLGWRWTHYLAGILGVASFVSVLFFLGESYSPVILVSKARSLRHEKRNWSIHAAHEEIELNIHAIFQDYFAIPLKLLALDPIILCICIFGAFVYGLLYLSITTYPIIFQQIHGMNPGVGGLPFIAVIGGQVFAGVVMYARQRSLSREIQANNGELVPEWLLLTAIPGSAAFSAGLFWLGWTGYRSDVRWIWPTLSGVLTGFGLITMFLPSVQYVVHVRRNRAASAIAAHTFLRSLAGSGFPLFATYMFKSLGVQWALTLLGSIAGGLFSIPVVLYVYGARIRAKSRLVL